MQIASSPMMRISCLRRRAYSLRSIIEWSGSGSMQRRTGPRRRVQFGVQQQRADADEFDHLGQRVFVFLGVAVFEARAGDRGEVAQDFPGFIGQRVAVAGTGQAQTAEKAAAPFDE